MLVWLTFDSARPCPGCGSVSNVFQPIVAGLSAQIDSLRRTAERVRPGYFTDRGPGQDAQGSGGSEGGNAAARDPTRFLRQAEWLVDGGDQAQAGDENSTFWGETMKRIPLPSGITAAFGQQTAATQEKMSQGGRRKAAGARRPRPAGPVKRRSGGKKRARAAGGRLKKGSAAAKRWGAKMRRLRKK